MVFNKDKILAEIAVRGVDYYNKDNRDNRDKKDKTLVTNNDFLSDSLGLASEEALTSTLVSMPLAFSQEEGALPHLLQAGAPTPLTENQIKSCIFQLFDNGEDSTQRYKYKIRLNLDDGTNPEFIASLTKDFRNFKKYIPEPYRQSIIDSAQEERSRIKQLTGSYPYCGKLHLNQGFGDSRKTIQIEPDTLVVCWWDPEERGWSGVVKIQKWAYEFDLFSDNITAKQKKQFVKAQGNWQNPLHQKHQRPKTWAQQRLEK